MDENRQQSRGSAPTAPGKPMFFPQTESRPSSGWMVALSLCFLLIPYMVTACQSQQIKDFMDASISIHSFRHLTFILFSTLVKLSLRNRKYFLRGVFSSEESKGEKCYEQFQQQPDQHPSGS